MKIFNMLFAPLFMISVTSAVYAGDEDLIDSDGNLFVSEREVVVTETGNGGTQVEFAYDETNAISNLISDPTDSKMVFDATVGLLHNLNTGIMLSNKLEATVAESNGQFIDAKGLAKLETALTHIQDQVAAIKAYALEADPNFEKNVQKILDEKGITGVAADLNRLKNLAGFAPLSGTYEVDIDDPKDTGFFYPVIDGRKYNCTTEGMMYANILSLNYALCIDARPGQVNGKQAYNFMYGPYLDGDKTVSLKMWDSKVYTVDYLLDLFNVAPDSDRAKYYNGLKFGGEHVNSKTFGNSATATNAKVVSVPFKAKSVRKVKVPMEVIVVNGPEKAVPVTKVK